MDPSTRNGWGTLQIVSAQRASWVNCGHSGLCGMGAPGPPGRQVRVWPHCPWVSLLQGLSHSDKRGEMPCSSSTRLRGPRLSVSSGVPQHRGVPAGRDTYINRVPTADSWGTPSPAPCPHPRLPRHPLNAPTKGRDSRVGGSLASPGCSALATSPGCRDSGFSLVKAPPRVLACLPQRRSVHQRPLPQELRRTDRAGRDPRGVGQGSPAHCGNRGSPGWHQPCPTHPILAGSSGASGSTNPRWGLLPSSSIPNSGTNLPLHRASSW